MPLRARPRGGLGASPETTKRTNDWNQLRLGVLEHAPDELAAVPCRGLVVGENQVHARRLEQLEGLTVCVSLRHDVRLALQELRDLLAPGGLPDEENADGARVYRVGGPGDGAGELRLGRRLDPDVGHGVSVRRLMAAGREGG